jgi:hypothetical protein
MHTGQPPPLPRPQQAGLSREGIRRPPAAAAVVAATATAADRSSRAHVSCPVAPSSDRHDPSPHHQPSPAVALRAAVD